MIRRILVPLESLDAQHPALLTAWRNFPFAEIDLLHAIAPVAPVPLPLAVGTVGEYALHGAHGSLPEEERQRAQAALNTLGHGEVVVSAQPAVNILLRAATGRYDLILMGTGRKGGLERFLLGSVAEAVVRGSPIPVMTVRLDSPSDAVPTQTGPFSRVLFLTDFSACAESSLDYVRNAFPACQISLLHVMPQEVVPLLIPVGPGIIIPDEERTQEQRQAARRKLAEYGSGSVVVGDPAQEALKRAQAGACDVIVIGTQAKGTLDRWLTGSVVSRIIRESPVPVLSARGLLKEAASRRDRGKGQPISPLFPAASSEVPLNS